MVELSYSLLTIKEAAAFLKVHPETVRRWYLKLGLRGLKIGKTLRFRIEDLIAFMEGGKDKK